MSEDEPIQTELSQKTNTVEQNGFLSQSTKSEKCITNLQSNSSSSIDSNDASTQNDEPIFSMDLDSDCENVPIICHKTNFATPSIESRVSEILELVQNGSLEELKNNITRLVRENEELKQKLNELKSHATPFDENSSAPNPEMEGGFCIDATPSQHDISIPDTPGLNHSSSINYEVINDEKLLSTSIVDEDVNKSKNSSVSGNCCFNCLGNHMISECKEPKDYKRINKNRRSFQSRQPISSARYHVEEQKFGHIQPGQPPSKALRRALGLRDERYLPPYIYQMRKLGYPPAWLKYAQINRKYFVSLIYTSYEICTEHKSQSHLQIDDLSKLFYL